jgi:hypothetical protein
MHAHQVPEGNHFVSSKWLTCKRFMRSIEKQGIMIHTFFFFLLGFLVFKEFCSTLSDEPVPQLKFYEEVFDEKNRTNSFCFSIDKTI